MDISTIAPILTGVLALVGGITAKILESKSRRLTHALSEEVDFRKMLGTRVDTLDLQLMMAMKTIKELEDKLHQRELSLQELTWKHEALKDAHAELLDRYKISEASNQQLKDEMLKWYLESNLRRTTPPPKAYHPYKLPNFKEEPDED